MSVWPAPAKLNLFLHIVGRRADGYHELQTCFQFVDLCDEIHLNVRDDGVIRRENDVSGVPQEHDLCVRAARALQTAAACRWGADVRVVKRIPMGAGLGGGSSDAATCLVALNHLWELRWPLARLAEIGLKLGADVPVFVHGRAAWAEGVGERLIPLYPPNAPAEGNFLILKPNAAINTVDVFKDPDLTRNSPPITIHGFVRAAQTGVGVRNDCESVVRRRYPDVAAALDWLGQFGSARLTGTGACVFLSVETIERGREILSKLPHGISGFLCRGLNDSPLLTEMERRR